MLFRLSGLLSAILGAGLFVLALSAFSIVWMCFSGNGPGGHSGVSSDDFKTGMLFLVIAFVGIATGLLCEWWTCKVWLKPKEHLN
jgi:hypothetical protein